MIKKTPLKKKLTKGKVCKNCKEKFDQQRFGQVVCGYECSIPYGQNLIKKEELVTAKAERRYIKVEKDKIKTLIVLKKELQPIINAIARLIDNGMPCISCRNGQCGDPNGIQFAGGHLKSVGGNELLRFNLHDIHRQCNKKCNMHLGGNELNFLRGLESDYGWKYANRIEYELKATWKDLRFNRTMISESIKVARIERNRLKKENKTYTAKARMDLRTEINKKIGIYV